MKLLYLSNDPEVFAKIGTNLSQQGYIIHYATKWDDFYQTIRAQDIKVVILEKEEGDDLGFTFLEKIKNFDPQIDIILIGESIPASEMISAIKNGAFDYLVRPANAEKLTEILLRIKSKVDLRKETYHLESKLAEKYVFEEMAGKSPGMLEVFALIEKVAKYPSSILITGETGTGKEMVSRAIHNLSGRRENKLVPCDCTAIPETLFESELFGYVKGAFTGALVAKGGLFKEAHLGTVFLDEIGEIPLTFQTKLLRVLEERQFRPLGSNAIVHVDVRVISATSRDLRENIKQRNFREDLFHRINIVEIHIPALRERKEDIPLLCRCFLDKYNRKFNKQIKGISQRAQKNFLHHPWPGNVRELENLIERAVMLCQDKFIDHKDLPEGFIKDALGMEKTDDLPYPFLNLPLMEMEKRHILETLKATNENKQKAARILGLTRQALYRKLKKLNIPI